MNAPTAANSCRSAADLFAEAGRRMDLPPRTRLECLAAEQALHTQGQALDARTATPRQRRPNQYRAAHARRTST
jgi:hypothetical protein